MPLAILQARMSSTRLPGKVLAPILGKPLILHAIERIERARTLDGVVLATSTDPSDDELARIAQEAGVVVRRGSLDDVLGRFVSVMDEFDPDHVVRLTGDNPLIDPEIIDQVVAAHLDTGAEYTSNTLERTFPRGLDVEVVRGDALRFIAASAVDEAAREHVTAGLYRDGSGFRLESVTQTPDRSNLRWTVDLPQDLVFVRAVYEALWPQNREFGQQQIVELGETSPHYRRTEEDATSEAIA